MIVDTLRIHSNNLNKKHYLLHEVIEFVGRIERLLVGQYQRLDHMQCPLLVLLKMFRSDMLLVSLAACIGFENRYLAGVLLFADRIHRQTPGSVRREISPTSVAYFIYSSRYCG